MLAPPEATRTSPICILSFLQRGQETVTTPSALPAVKQFFSQGWLDEMQNRNSNNGCPAASVRESSDRRRALHQGLQQLRPCRSQEDVGLRGPLFHLVPLGGLLLSAANTAGRSSQVKVSMPAALACKACDRPQQE